MNTVSEVKHQPDSSKRSTQYRDLVRRRTLLDGEQRLLWAILEDGIKTYLTNKGCATRSQRAKFAKARSWFEPSQAEPQGPFSYETVCDSLSIGSGRLLKGLKLFDRRASNAAP